MSENIKTALIAIMGVTGILLAPMAGAAVTSVSNDQAMYSPPMATEFVTVGGRQY